MRFSCYAWDWGNGTTTRPTDASTARQTYAEFGDYTVTLTVTDSGGNSDRASRVISLGPNSFSQVIEPAWEKTGGVRLDNGTGQSLDPRDPGAIGCGTPARATD